MVIFKIINSIINKGWRIPKGQSKIGNPEKLATQTKNKAKSQHNIWWIPRYANKHK